MSDKSNNSTLQNSKDSTNSNNNQNSTTNSDVTVVRHSPDTVSITSSVSHISPSPEQVPKSSRFSFNFFKRNKNKSSEQQSQLSSQAVATAATFPLRSILKSTTKQYSSKRKPNTSSDTPIRSSLRQINRPPQLSQKECQSRLDILFRRKPRKQKL